MEEGEGKVTDILDDRALDILFRQARTHKAWRDQAVSDVLLEAVYDLARMGPTSLNCCPMRVVFVRSEAAKARLAPALSKGNLEKTMAAPVTAIVAQDMQFYEALPRLAPQGDFRAMFEGKPRMIESTAFRNSSLQGAYLMLAARALGLDCGPMSGFDAAALDQEFFPNGRVMSNFLCNLGFGDPNALHPRQTRLAFEEACRVL